MSQNQTVTFSAAKIRKTADRTWEAEWLTNVVGGFSGDEGLRVVSLTASHHDGAYKVTATIATAIENATFKVRQFRFGTDPFVTLSKEKARFSQKRLETLFDEALNSFDHKAFYATHEVTG